MDGLSLFTDEELAVDVEYPVGSFWRIKHVHLDAVTGKVEQRYTTTGMVYRHGTWNNQFRIDYALSQRDKYGKYEAFHPEFYPIEEYREEPEIYIYTGRHFTGIGGRVWISRITEATQLYGAEIDALTKEWQAWWDEWVWTLEEFLDKTKAMNDPEVDVVGLPWVPQFSHYMDDCPHQHTFRNVNGVLCRQCNEYIEGDPLPSINERTS